MSSRPQSVPTSPAAPTLTDEVDAALASPAASIASGHFERGIAQLFARLDAERGARPPADWDAFRAACRRHPLYALFDEDPLLHRCRTRPRGYAGDAGVIDFIYRAGAGLPDDVSPLGAALHRATITAEPAAAVRRRLEHIVATLDETARHRGDVDALSVACGHLREADRSVAVRTGRASVVALDQDTESLALVAGEQDGRRVTTLRADIRDLIVGRCVPGTFDLVWSAGLYDYLEERAAAALTRRLVAFLRPGGRLLVANFTPRCSCIGFMETFMDWTLVYRTADELARLTDGIGGIEATTFHDASGAIAWLDVVRR